MYAVFCSYMYSSSYLEAFEYENTHLHKQNVICSTQYNSKACCCMHVPLLQ